MIMTKMGNTSDTTKIMYANNEIQTIYYRNNIVWSGEKTVTGAINGQGYLASGSNISGGTRGNAPLLTGTYYYYIIGNTDSTAAPTIPSSSSTWTYNCGTLNLGIYSGKFIKSIAVKVCGAASISALNSQSDVRVRFIIKDNLGNVLWQSSSYRVGDFSGSSTVNFSAFNGGTNITLTPNRIITGLNCQIVYSGLNSDSSRTQQGAYNISFRNMNITYKG